MSTDRDTTRVVRSWLRSTEFHASADRVLDELVLGLDTTPQHRATWWPVRRKFPMNNFAKVGLAAAAVVVAALLGYAYLVAPNVGAPGMDDPTPSPSASLAPEAMPLPFSGPSLEPGTYRVSAPLYTPVAVEFDVPEGWSSADSGAIGKNADLPSSVSLALYVVTHVYTDACQSEGTLTEIGPSPDDLVTALLAIGDLAVEGPTDTVVGDYPAQRVDVGYPPGLDTSTCRNPGILIQVWANEAETDFFALADGYAGSVYVVDVDGQRVVITTDHGPEASAQDRAELDQIIGSMQFATEP